LIKIKTSTRKKKELKRDTKSMPRLMMDPRKKLRRLLQKNRKTNSRPLRKRSEENTDPEEVEAAEVAEEAVAEEAATSTKMMTIRKRGSHSPKRLMRSLSLLK
jgi:hypothetical protein